MSVKVVTPLLPQYHMAGACVGCGAPATPGVTHKAAFSKSAGKYTMTTSLEFPVCQACADASRHRLLGWIPLGLAFIFTIWPLIAAVFVVIGAAFEMDLAGVAIGLVLGGISGALLLLGVWLKERIDTWGMSADQVERRRVLDRSVRIETVDEGTVVFEFDNPSYAVGFSSMNLGHQA